MLYMVTFTINIPQMLAYIPAPWILWVELSNDKPSIPVDSQGQSHLFPDCHLPEFGPCITYYTVYIHILLYIYKQLLIYIYTIHIHLFIEGLQPS